jgi:hypothetical protein
MVQDLDNKFTARIEKEIARIKETHDEFVEEMLQRVGEQHRYSNAIKDEVDRLAEKVRSNQSEVLSYNKSLAGSLKKLRGDQIVQDEDLSRAW